ncbi:MAG: DUF2889 domain-containing protein [Deltaproteobacteria bacterium]|nr:DUF2889 domain-containing protein [Deltaproteobacteria bacterium]MBR5705572.1 DUF2889 domain-containing protein [Deltaproteobacteria bacterium]
MSLPQNILQRDIRHTVSTESNGTIHLSATMLDPYHDMELHITVSRALLLEDIELIWRKSPSPHCQDITRQLETLKGTSIGHGIVRRVCETLGGSSGCGNLRSILLGLLPLAINAHAAYGHSEETEMYAAMDARMRGVCAGFPKET